MISIIIPTIGRSSTIGLTLESACRSSKAIVTEIVLVDNSADNVFGCWVRQCIADMKDSRLVLISNSSKLSMADCWNVGLKTIHNSWVIFLHDDDYLNPSALDGELILNSNVGLIIFDYCIQYESIFGVKKKLLIRKKNGINKGESIINDCPKFAATIFNVTAIERCGSWSNDYGYFLDLVLMFKICKLFDAHFVNKELGTYVYHGENASSKQMRSRFYGDYIPATVSAVYELSSSDRERSAILKLCNNFVYSEFNEVDLRTKIKIKIIKMLKAFKAFCFPG